MNEIDFASYADDKTPYVSCDSIEDVIRILENDSEGKQRWISSSLLLVVMSMSQWSWVI